MFLTAYISKLRHCCWFRHRQNNIESEQVKISLLWIFYACLTVIKKYFLILIKLGESSVMFHFFSFCSTLSLIIQNIIKGTRAFYPLMLLCHGYSCCIVDAAVSWMLLYQWIAMLKSSANCVSGTLSKHSNMVGYVRMNYVYLKSTSAFNF